MESGPPSRVGSMLRVITHSRDVHHNHRLLPDHSRMAWRHHGKIPWAKFLLRPILHPHAQSARDVVRKVGRLAAFGMDQWLYTGGRRKNLGMLPALAQTAQRQETSL